MTRTRLDGLFLFVLGSVIFVWMGFALERSSNRPLTDFKGIYYSARCLLIRCDPYNQSELLRAYQDSKADRPSDPQADRGVVEVFVHLPTAFILTAPFGLLPWGPAHILWMSLTAAIFIFAAYLMWDLGAEHAPIACSLPMCAFLINSELLVEIGNAAGIVIGLCVIAAWCFIRGRYVSLGILCLAISLSVRPHDAGPVWLYFLLAGGVCRRYALRTFLVTIAIGLPMVLWVSYVAPHWLTELHTSASAMSMHGNVSDPGPATVDSRFHGALAIDLQSAISILRDDPRIYNPVSYLICAPLMLVWAVAVLRKRFSQQSAWLALAVISALSMLPLYHRTHDTRMLLLGFPAFGVIWAKGGLTARIGLLLNVVGAVVIGVVPQQLLTIYSANLLNSIHGVPGQLLAILFTRPVPLILLALSVFYLWVFVRHTLVPDPSAGRDFKEQERPSPVLVVPGAQRSAILDGGIPK